MELQAERLRLVPMTSGDVEFFHETNNDPFVRRYLWDDEAVPLAVSKEILRGVESAFDDAGWGLWKAVDMDAATLGYIGLWTFFEEPQPQLVYALSESYTGRGYASEASIRVMEHAFDTLSFEYLDASMDVANAASVRVCERLGFELHDERQINGKPIRFYRMHSKDWGGAYGNRR